MGVPRTVFLALAAALSLAATAALAIGAPLNTLYGLSLLMGGCRFGCGHRWCVCVCLAGWSCCLLVIAVCTQLYIAASGRACRPVCWLFAPGTRLFAQVCCALLPKKLGLLEILVIASKR